RGCDQGVRARQTRCHHGGVSAFPQGHRLSARAVQPSFEFALAVAAARLCLSAVRGAAATLASGVLGLGGRASLCRVAERKGQGGARGAGGTRWALSST